MGGHGPLPETGPESWLQPREAVPMAVNRRRRTSCVKQQKDEL